MSGAAFVLVNQAASIKRSSCAELVLRSGVLRLTKENRSPLVTVSAIARSEGVAVSGGLMLHAPPPVRVVRGDEDALPAAYTTVGFPEVFAPGLTPGAVTVGPELIELGEVGPHQLIWLGSDRIRVEEITPTWVPTPQMRAGVTLPSGASGLLAECWVRMEPGSQQVGGAVLQGWLGTGTRVTEFAPSASVASPWQQWRAVVDLQPGLVAGGVIGLVGILVHWNRRAEYATRKIFGSTPSEISTMCGLEALFVLVPAAVCSVGVVAVLAIVEVVPATVATIPLASMCAISAALAAIGIHTVAAQLMAQRSALIALRDH